MIHSSDIRALICTFALIITAAPPWLRAQSAGPMQPSGIDKIPCAAARCQARAAHAPTRGNHSAIHGQRREMVARFEATRFRKKSRPGNRAR